MIMGGRVINLIYVHLNNSPGFSSGNENSFSALSFRSSLRGTAILNHGVFADMPSLHLFGKGRQTYRQLNRTWTWVTAWLGKRQSPLMLAASGLQHYVYNRVHVYQ